MRAWILASFMVMATGAARAEIFVEPSETLVDEQRVLGGGAYAWYTFPLQAGDAIQVGLQSTGGLDNAIQIWLVDISNLQLLKSGQPFKAWPSASPHIVQQGSFSFNAPVANVYYLVLDNRAALTARNIAIHVDRNTGTPTARSNALTEIYSGRYDALKSFFVFRDFDVHVRPCGAVNAFSTPNIVMCMELIDAAQREGVPAAELFVFYHEVGHSLLNLWRYPTFDNEDTADEFATVMMILMGQESAALQAAQWWAAGDSRSEARAKPFMDDRHSLSVQRARNIINWLNRKEDLVSRWLRVMIPNMTDTALTQLEKTAAASAPGNTDEAAILATMRDELQKRQHLAGN